MKNWLKNSRKPSIGSSKVTRSYTGIAWAVPGISSLTIALCVAADATNPAKTVFRPPDNEAQLSGPKPMDPQTEAIVSNFVNRGVTPNRTVEMAQRAAAGLDPVSDPIKGMNQLPELNREKVEAGNKAIAQTIAQGGGSNNSQFVYDNFNRIVKIIETRSGSVTSTKQFIWANDGLCEERDSSGNLTKQFFAYGQTINGSPYYYTRDRLGSVREMTNSSGNVVAQYSYGLDGRVTKLQGNTVDSDFGYAGLYAHKPSGLNLAIRRGYYPILGRFLNRDPIGEGGGLNLYAYAGNDPVRYVDPTGLSIWIEGPSANEPFGHKSICVGNPLGHYDCLSFCINPSLPNGRVYFDPFQGGPILRYKVTTPEQDNAFIAGLPKIGSPDWYGPCNNCRTFSEKQFDNAPGVETSPPFRAPVGYNPPPFSWTTQPVK